MRILVYEFDTNNLTNILVNSSSKNTYVTNASVLFQIIE